VLRKVCGDCGRIHDGKEQICKDCTTSDEVGTLRTGRGQYWIMMALIEKKLARSGEEQEQWKRRETLWKKVVKDSKSRARGRDADAPAGGPRGPNSEVPSDEEYDDDDYDYDYDYNSNEDNDEEMGGHEEGELRGHKRTQEDA